MHCRQNDPQESSTSASRFALSKTAFCFQPLHPLLGAKQLSFRFATKLLLQTYHSPKLPGRLWTFAVFRTNPAKDTTLRDKQRHMLRVSSGYNGSNIPSDQAQSLSTQTRNTGAKAQAEPKEGS